LKAWVNLRYTVPERKRIFSEGLSKLGYTVMDGITDDPGPKDILISWNRPPVIDKIACEFERRGLQVLCTENAAWGNDFAGGHWYSIARTRHNTAGMFPIGGPERWDALGIDLKPFRTEGETVILPQRGIGSPPTAMPLDWPTKALKTYGGRIRKHPGRFACKPLEDDLANCGKVVTWGSGAAIKALIMGIPVESHMPLWIGAQNNTDEGRLAMFRRLAHAQWTLQEISEGLPFRRLLNL
jgi:hypothetical protein